MFTCVHFFFPPPALPGSGSQGQQQASCPLSRVNPAPHAPYSKGAHSLYLSLTNNWIFKIQSRESYKKQTDTITLWRNAWRMFVNFET